jgi:para-nitrobenzyl esterase
MKHLMLESGPIAIGQPDTAGIRVFKGLPYSAPPTGDNRFKAPQPCPPWTAIRLTDRFGHNSLQRVVFDDIDPMVDGVSEDCLYLNVWTGADLAARERLPVLFWIHGGGFVVGSGSEPRYNGANLAKRGVIVVTVNHRLNALGFLSHPALSADGASGNYGMLDLVAALQWVQRNIAVFGGDPARVTIAGESAGSMAASILMCSPLAKGLFVGVIGQSGGLLATPAEPLMSRDEAHEHGNAFAKKLGVTTAKELRTLSAEKIQAAAPGLGFRPTIDGHFLPRHPQEIFEARLQHDVPLLAGWNKDEGFAFTVDKWGDGTRKLTEWLGVFFGAATSVAAQHYPLTDAKQSARDLGGDLIINHGAWQWIEAQKHFGISPIYQYRFDRAPKTQAGWFGPDYKSGAGAFHSCEIPYVFDNVDALGWKVTEEDRAIAKSTADYWVNFITTGNPNGQSLAYWPPNRDPNAPALLIDTVPAVEMDIDGARHRFLAEVLR